MSQIENSKRTSLQAVQFRDLEIRNLNLFRISKFELRISKGNLDHFVNFVVTKKTKGGIKAPAYSGNRVTGSQTIKSSQKLRALRLDPMRPV
jgi:hypothetical protein